MDESAWAFASWTEAAAAAADDFAVTEPVLTTRYVYAGEDGALNLKASAEGRSVSLQLEGSGWRTPSPDAERILARNAAHEVAHLFQYAAWAPREAQVPQEKRWLHEGFADALAHEALAARGEAAGWGGGTRCAGVLEDGSIVAAQRAGEPAALYDCSSLVVRAVAAARGESVRDLYRALAEAGGSDAAFLRLAEEGRRARSVTAFLTTDYTRADAGWVIRQLRAGRL